MKKVVKSVLQICVVVALFANLAILLLPWSETNREIIQIVSLSGFLSVGLLVALGWQGCSNTKAPQVGSSSQQEKPLDTITSHKAMMMESSKQDVIANDLYYKYLKGKAKAEAESLIKECTEEAARILKQAHKEAEEVLAKAHKDADESFAKAMSLPSRYNPPQDTKKFDRGELVRCFWFDHSAYGSVFAGNDFTFLEDLGKNTSRIMRSSQCKRYVTYHIVPTTTLARPW